MIRISRKVEYGLIALLHIANMESDALVTNRALAKHYRIPGEILGKVLQSLVKSNLLESIQGVKGGYRLGKPLDEIAVGEVMEAVDGPIQLTPCCCETYVCKQEPQCNIKEPVFHFQDQLMKFVYNLSVGSFYKNKG